MQLKDVETEVGRALSKHEKRLEELEAVNTEKNRELQQVESAISFARKQLKTKQEAAGELQQAVQSILSPDFEDAEEAVKVCAEEIAAAKDEYASIDSLDSFLRRVLREAKGKGHCFACNRGVSPSEYEAIEKHVSSTLSSSNTASKKKGSQGRH